MPRWQLYSHLALELLIASSSISDDLSGLGYSCHATMPMTAIRSGLLIASSSWKAICLPSFLSTSSWMLSLSSDRLSAEAQADNVREHALFCSPTGQ